MASKGLHINVYKLPGSANVWRCDIKLNTSKDGEGVTIRGTSEDDGDTAMGSWWGSLKSKLSKPARAIEKAKTLTRGLLQNKLVAAALPPYLAPALLALDAMVKADKHGKLTEVKKKLTDPTLRKLARELDEMSRGQRSAMSGGGVCLACDASEKKDDDKPRRPFNLPTGNPHPFAMKVAQADINRGVYGDDTMLQKLARIQQYQRGMARKAR